MEKIIVKLKTTYILLLSKYIWLSEKLYCILPKTLHTRLIADYSAFWCETDYLPTSHNAKKKSTKP